MKKIKYIPLLALTAVLSGCNFGSSISLKAPKFESEGSEFSFEEMKTEQEKSDFYGAFSAGDYTVIPSAIIKGSSGYSSKLVVKEGKSVKRERDYKQVSSHKYTFDVDNKRIEMKTESKGITKDKSTSSSAENQSTTKSDGGYRYYTIEDKLWMVSFNNLTKTYSKNMDASALDEEHLKMDIQARCDLYADAVYSNFKTAVDYYSYRSDEEKAKYKCYKNDKIYTITYLSDTTKEEKNSSDEVLYKEVKVVSEKIQVNVSKGSEFTYKRSKETTIKVEFSKDATYNYNEYRAGQVLESSEKNYEEAAVTTSGINLKEVDLSSYAFISE